jgi:site-specific DNA recombinase
MESFASMRAAITRFEVRRKGEHRTRANAQRATKGGVPKAIRLTNYTTDGQIVYAEVDTVRAQFEGFATGLTCACCRAITALSRAPFVQFR